MDYFNIAKPISLRFFMLLTALAFIVPTSHIEANQCVDVFNDQRQFPAWSADYLSPLDQLKPRHFFPRNYLNEAASQGRSISLKIVEVDDYGKSTFVQSAFHSYLNSIVGLRFTDDDGLNFVQFDLWKGTQPDRIVVENLLIENRLATKRVNKLRQSQDSKGLPPKVFFHMRNQLFSFLKAGGYKQIEINTSQDILVYYLYNKLVGAKPANELALQMNSYLSYIIENTIKGNIPEVSATSTTDFSKYIGNGHQDPFPQLMHDLWKRSKNNPAHLKTYGFKPIYTVNENLVAIQWQGHTAFIVPFLPGKPLLTWRNLYENYPDTIKMIKNISE